MRLKWSTLTVDEDDDESFVRRRRPVSKPVVAAAEPVQHAGRKRVLFHLIAGAVAGATAKTVEAPLDRVKIIFQVSKSRFSFRAAARQMVAIASNEGIQGLWKGNGTRPPRRTAASTPSARPWAGSWSSLGDLTAGAARPGCGRRNDDARHPVRLHQLCRTRDAVAGALRAWLVSRRTLQLSRQGASPARVHQPAPCGRVQRACRRSLRALAQRRLA